VAAARARQATAPRTTTSSTATPAPAGREDLSQSLTFDISAPAIDFDKGRLSVSMRVVNSSARTVRAPIDVVIDRLLSIRSQAMGLKNLKVANADNGVAGVGATWTFEAGPGGALPPGAKSPARRLEFTFEGGYPAEPAGYFEPVFRIYAAGTEAPPPSTSGPRPPARHD
jgi:hypothetical protein